jgi:CheY-like chemotaxis protein
MRLGGRDCDPFWTTQQTDAAGISELSALIWRVWTGSAAVMRERLDAIDAAGAALLEGALDDTRRDAAISSAHKLRGSLGAFGLPEGTALASEIEALLRSPTAPSVLRVCELAELLHAVVAAGPIAPDIAVEVVDLPPILRIIAVADGAAELAGAVIDVLLVEDDDALSQLLVRALESSGYTAAVISDGRLAVEMLTGAAPLSCRVILLDVDLPGLDGLAVLRQLTAAGVTERTPTIMLTVRSSESEVLEALQSGAVDHVAKPFSTPVLMERIRLALER